MALTLVPAYLSNGENELALFETIHELSNNLGEFEYETKN